MEAVGSRSLAPRLRIESRPRTMLITESPGSYIINTPAMQVSFILMSRVYQTSLRHSINSCVYVVHAELQLALAQAFQCFPIINV